MLVYGKNVLKEVVTQNKKIYKAYIQKGINDKSIAELLKDVNVYQVEKRELDRLTNGNHQGIALEIEGYNYYDEKEVLNKLKNDSFIVILDHIEDPHNFGAIIRTCEAAGVDYIVIPKNRSVSINSTVMKVSVGATNLVKIAKVVNINNFISKLKKQNTWIIGTSLQDCVAYTDVDYKDKVALVIGNEANGISPLVKKNCDFLVKIPMIGKINSLNASVAAGIMIYEVIRQRGKNE